MASNAPRNYYFRPIEELPNTYLDPEIGAQIRNIIALINRHVFILTPGNMRYELLRLLTFILFSPRDIGFHKVFAFAVAGFYYIREENSVACFRCGLCLGNWKEETESPYRIHRRNAHFCEFFNRHSVNIPFFRINEGGIRRSTDRTSIRQHTPAGPEIVLSAEDTQRNILRGIRRRLAESDRARRLFGSSVDIIPLIIRFPESLNQLGVEIRQDNMSDGAEVELENVSESPPITQSQINQDHSINVNEDPQNEADVERCMSTSCISEESGCPMTGSVNQQENSTTLHDDLISTNREADLEQEYGSRDQIHAIAGLMTGDKPPDQCISNDPVGRQNISSNGDEEQTELKMICKAESKDNKSAQRDFSNRISGFKDEKNKREVSEMETVIPTVSCDETDLKTEHDQNLERTPTGPVEEDHMNANTVTFESQGSTSKEDYAYRNDSDIPNNMHDQEPYSSYNSTCSNAPSHDEKEDTEGSVGKDQTNAKRDASSQPQVSTSKKVNAYRNDSDILDVKCDQELVPTDLSSNASELSHNETEDTEGSVAKVHTNAERDSLESQVSTSNGVNTNENDSHIPNEKHDQHHVPIDTSSNASQLSHNKTEDTEGSLQESTNAHTDNLKSQISTSKAANAYVYNSCISSDIRGPELLPPDLSSNVNEFSNNETEYTEGSVEKGQMNVKRDTLLKNEMSTSTEVNTNGNDSGKPNDKHDRHHLPTDLSCNASQLSHNKPDDKEGSVEKGQTNAKRDALLHSQVSTSKEVNTVGKDSDISNGKHGQDIFPSDLSSNASGLSHNETKDKEVVCEPELIRNEQRKTVIMEESSKLVVLEVQEENELHNGNFVYQPCEDVSTEKERNIAPWYKGSKRLEEGASVALTDGKTREISLSSCSPTLESHFRKYASNCSVEKVHTNAEKDASPQSQMATSNEVNAHEKDSGISNDKRDQELVPPNLSINASELSHNEIEDTKVSVEKGHKNSKRDAFLEPQVSTSKGVNTNGYGADIPNGKHDPEFVPTDLSRNASQLSHNETEETEGSAEKVHTNAKRDASSQSQMSTSNEVNAYGNYSDIPNDKHDQELVPTDISTNASKHSHNKTEDTEGSVEKGHTNSKRGSLLKYEISTSKEVIDNGNDSDIPNDKHDQHNVPIDLIINASQLSHNETEDKEAVVTEPNVFESEDSKTDIMEEFGKHVVVRAQEVNKSNNGIFVDQPCVDVSTEKERNIFPSSKWSKGLRQGTSVALADEKRHETSHSSCSSTMELHFRKNASKDDDSSMCLRRKRYIRDDPIGIPDLPHMINVQNCLDKKQETDCNLIASDALKGEQLIRNHEEEFSSNESSEDEIDPSLVSKQIYYEAHYNNSERNQTELSKKEKSREGHEDDTDDLLQSALADFHKVVDPQKRAVIISSLKQHIAECLSNNISDK